MFDRFVSSMNSAWVSTKQAVQDSVEFAKDNTTRQISVSDQEVQQANDRYEQIIATIKTINMKVELLNSELVTSSQHLIEMSTAFSEMINFVDKTRNQNKETENNNEPSEQEEKIESDKSATEEQFSKIQIFSALARGLGERLIPRYVLQGYNPIYQRLVELKETKDNVHKICLDMDLIKKQMTGTVTKPIVGKMQKPQQKLASLSNKLATVKPDYLNQISALSQEFEETRKKSYTALIYYEQQYLAAIEKYILNPRATPSYPPFTDYSDMTSILPNYLQLLSSKKKQAEDE
ncbi:hypothetical protein M9Y10_024021 [Tritrichomonas musculus]|uniref:BAR domain-containing protein n=1 Tax=Tritrichomonas musculus TaxID=1915356 RepID=A0ABR2KWS7_9EUKA